MVWPFWLTGQFGHLPSLVIWPFGSSGHSASFDVGCINCLLVCGSFGGLAILVVWPFWLTAQFGHLAIWVLWPFCKLWCWLYKLLASLWEAAILTISALLHIFFHLDNRWPQGHIRTVLDIMRQQAAAGRHQQRQQEEVLGFGWLGWRWSSWGHPVKAHSDWSGMTCFALSIGG